MPNRYSSPAQAQFMNTYIPIPFDNILQAGLSKQQQYNTGQAAIDTAQAQADALKYIPGSRDEQFINEDVIGTVKEVADEFGSQDFSDPVVMRAINKRLKAIDRNRVNRTQQSAEAYGKAGEIRRKLKAEGAYRDYLDDTDVSNFSSEYDIYNKTPERALDRRKPAEAIFNNLPDRYLYDKDLGNGMKAIMQGVGDSELRSAARNASNDYLSSPEGGQFAKYLKSVGVPEENYLAETEKYLYEVGLEQRGARQSSIYKDPSFKGNESITNQFTDYSSATFDLEAESYSKEFTNFKKAMKSKESNDAKIAQLDQEINLAKKQANPTANARARVLQGQKESLQAQGYAIDQYFEKFNNEYVNKVGKSKEDFYTEMLGPDGNPNFRKVMKEYLHDNSIISTFASTYNNLFSTEGDKYPIGNTYGADDASKMSKIASDIKEKYTEYEKDRVQYMEDQWKTIDKGITKETVFLPNTNTTGDKIQVPGTQDWVYNPLQGILNAYESNPEALDIRRITGEQLSEKEKNKDLELIKETLVGNPKTGKRGKLEFQSAGSFDPKSPFLNAVLYDAEGTRIDNFAINVSNTTQQKKIAESYALIGDVKNALKFENPAYSQNIAKKFEKGIKPETVDLSILNNDIQLVLSSDKSFYQIYSEGRLIPNSSIRASGGDIESAIYDLYKDNIMKIRQASIINNQ